MAIVGQALTAPESGWRRYDNTDSRFIYNGTWTSATNSSYYNNSLQYSNDINSFISFKFYGSKLRIIDEVNTNRSSNIKITIDGVDYVYSDYGTSAYQILLFEKSDLLLGLHTVRISNMTNGVYYSFDAIDIDDTGYLAHPTLPQKTDVESLNIGDVIPCKYIVSTSGNIGVFSEFGTCTSALLPNIPVAVPNGLFYWVFVGYDAQNRMKFIADRIVQIAISWNTLNASGIVSGLPVNFVDNNFYNQYIRLMTGGVVATQDIDNEWDRIIVNSTLNGLITSGDNNIWHYGNSYPTLISTTSASANTSRIMRGLTSNINYSSSIDVATATNGFRPVLIIEQKVIVKHLIKDGTDLKTISGGNLVKVCNTTDDETIRKGAYLSSGMNNLSLWTNSLLTQVTTKPPYVCTYRTPKDY